MAYGFERSRCVSIPPDDPAQRRVADYRYYTRSDGKGVRHVDKTNTIWLVQLTLIPGAAVQCGDGWTQPQRHAVSRHLTLSDGRENGKADIVLSSPP
jgi:hypothetical protein